VKNLLFLVLIISSTDLFSQTNIVCTDSMTGQVLLGKYNPLNFHASIILNRPDSIFNGISTRINPDTLKSYVFKLATFYNRNTASDTISQTTGIGAARRWVYSKFQQYGSTCQNRLRPAYLQFTLNICTVMQHRNVIAVLPGLDTTDKSIIIIEGHIDSRCANVCDTASKAEGVEDNGSGAALVLELARVMSKYSYNNTMVFMATTGEEQGLYGANAFASYALQKGIKIKAVLNNDVIGGIICGFTSSAPSCPGYGNLDSTQVRIFSLGSFNSPHKGLARFVKLEYKENLLPGANVPMRINVMASQDRAGRGGDHEPFNSAGFTAIRFTAANEDGDADVTDSAYKDRQHTSGDSLGTFKKNRTSSTIDSLFVNFPYLSRNAIINGNAAGMLGIGPNQPDCNLTSLGSGALRIQVTKQTQYPEYRIGLRSSTNDWDSVYTMKGILIDTLKNLPSGTYYVSIMSDDTNNIESLPSIEYTAAITGIGEITSVPKVVELLQNKPNPFDLATYISVKVNQNVEYQDAYISVKDGKGVEIQRLPVKLTVGIVEAIFEHGYHPTGIYIYTLVIDGQAVESKQMIFAN